MTFHSPGHHVETPLGRCDCIDDDHSRITGSDFGQFPESICGNLHHRGSAKVPYIESCGDGPGACVLDRPADVELVTRSENGVVARLVIDRSAVPFG